MTSRYHFPFFSFHSFIHSFVRFFLFVLPYLLVSFSLAFRSHPNYFLLPSRSHFHLLFISIPFIRLSTSFKVETSHECEYDSLEVYNGLSQDDTQRLSKLCGSHLPSQIVSSGPELLVRFHSDFSVGFQGFKLQFERSGKLMANTNEQNLM